MFQEIRIETVDKLIGAVLRLSQAIEDQNRLSREMIPGEVTVGQALLGESIAPPQPVVVNISVASGPDHIVRQR